MKTPRAVYIAISGDRPAKTQDLSAAERRGDLDESIRIRNAIAGRVGASLTSANRR